MNFRPGGWLGLSVVSATVVAAMLVVLPIVVITLQSRATTHRNRAVEVAEPLATATRVLDSAVLSLSSTANLRATGAPIDEEVYLNRRAEVVQGAEALTTAAQTTPFESRVSDLEQHALELVELYDAVKEGEIEDPSALTPFGDGPLADYFALSNELESSIGEFRSRELSETRQLERYSAAAMIIVSAIAAIVFVLLARATAVRIRAEREIRAREERQSTLAEYGRRALVLRLDIGALRREAINRIAVTFDVEYVALTELLPDGQALVLRDGLGWEKEAVGALEVPADRDSHAGYTLLQDRPVSFVDLESEERFQSPELINRGLTSGIAALVRLHDRIWGVIGAYSKSRRQFSEDDALFMRSVANVLATSILERDAQVRQRILIETSAVLAQSVDDPASLAGVARVAVPDVADHCLILLLNDDGSLQVSEVASAEDTELAEQLATLRGSAIGEGSVAWSALEGRESTIHNWLDAGDLFGGIESEPGSMQLTGLTLLSVLVAPITGRNQAIGAIAMICETGRFFPDSDASLGVEIGSRIGLALENARLFERTLEIAEVREDFAHVVAHELRNPLTSVLGYSRILLRTNRAGDASLPPDDIESLQTIYQSAERMQVALETFVALARIEGDEPLVEPDLIDLAAEVRREIAVTVARSAATVRVHEEFDSDPVEVVTDPDLLRVVLRNLIENGIKYGGSPAELQLRIRTDGADVEISVEDNGDGIPPDERAQVFERGYRGETGTSATGSGLGLFIAARLATALHGRLEVHEGSTLPGARFVLTLPTGTEVA